MTPLPPAQRETSEEVGNDDSHAGVDLEVVGDAHMAGIVRGEDELMPETSHEERRSFVPAVFQADHRSDEQSGIPGDLACIRPVIAIEETFGADLGFERAVLDRNLFLRVVIQRRIFCDVFLDGLAGEIIGVECARATDWARRF